MKSDFSVEQNVKKRMAGSVTRYFVYLFNFGEILFI